MSKSYMKRERGMVFLDYEDTWAYVVHLPAELRAKMFTEKEKTGRSFNMQVIEALEEYFVAHPT